MAKPDFERAMAGEELKRGPAMSASDRPTRDDIVKRLEWACKHYCDWYDGTRSDDAADVAYALVSEIRVVLQALKEAPHERV